MCREEKLLVLHNKLRNSCLITSLKNTEAANGGAEAGTGGVP